MSEWALLRTIVGREYRAWKKPFLVSSAVILVVIAAGLGIAAFVGSNASAPSFVVATTGDTPAGFASSVAEFLPADATLETVPFASVSAAEAAVDSGEVNAAVVDDYLVIWGTGVTDALGDGIAQTLVLAQARRRAADLGLSPAAKHRLPRRPISAWRWVG